MRQLEKGSLQHAQVQEWPNDILYLAFVHEDSVDYLVQTQLVLSSGTSKSTVLLYIGLARID
jgi:hypothetical protein